MRLEFLSRWFIEMEHYSEAIALLADAVKRQNRKAA